MLPCRTRGSRFETIGTSIGMNSLNRRAPIPHRGSGDNWYFLSCAWTLQGQYGYSILAVDRATSKAPSATFVQRDLLRPAEIPSQHENWATHAVCSEVLEHLDDPAGLLEAAKAYMRPGCTLVVTVPGGPMSAFDRHIGHRIHYTPGKLRSLLSGLGFNVKYAGGVGFPFFNLYRLMVICLGKSLINAASSANDSLLARVAMRVFRALFCLNTRSPLGWQIAAEAHLTTTTQSGASPNHCAGN